MERTHLAFLKMETIRMLGGKTMAVDTMLMYSWCSVKDMGPIVTAETLSAPSSARKNMQFVIMVRKRRQTQQEMRWTRVKLLLVGREKTENHMWSLLIFLRREEEKRCLNAIRSSWPATGMMRST